MADGATPVLDIFIDYACPWCYFEMRAVALAAEARAFPVRWRSFILRPDVPFEGEAFDARDLVDKNPPIYARMAHELGLAWPGQRTRRFRTQAAHVLMKAAEDQGRLAAYHAAVFEAYFVQQRNVAEGAVLRGILEAAAVEVPDLGAALHAQSPYVQRVEADLALAHALDVGGVPTLALGGRLLANFLPPAQLGDLMDRLAA